MKRVNIVKKLRKLEKLKKLETTLITNRYVFNSERCDNF